MKGFLCCLQPLMFLWERFVHTQGLPYYFRLPSRLPVGVLCSLSPCLSASFGALLDCFHIPAELLHVQQMRLNEGLPCSGSDFPTRPCDPIL